MSDQTIARRYALALSEQAADTDKTTRVDEDLALLKESLDASGELVRFFESPIISRKKKIAALRGMFSDRMDGLTLRFLELLVEKRRERSISRILQAYRDLRDEQQGLVAVQARVARELSDAESSQLEKAVSEVTGSKVRLTTTVDESILGGMVIRVGDTVYDGSVTNKLAALSERLRTRAAVVG